MNQLERDTRKSFGMSYAKGGAHFVSTGDTYTGNFYGITIVIAPDSLKIDTEGSLYELNGSDLVSTDDIVDYLPTGTFIPIHFQSITLGSNGYVILWKR